jgi:hypothetical protein
MVSKLAAAAPSSTAANIAANTTANTADGGSSNGGNRGSSNNTKGGNPEMKAALVLLNMVLNGTANNTATDNSTGKIWGWCALHSLGARSGLSRQQRWSCHGDSSMKPLQVGKWLWSTTPLPCGRTPEL